MLAELTVEEIEQTIRTAHNKQFGEMAVGAEAISLLHPSTSVIAQVMVRPVRHFAKLPGVMRHIPYCGGELRVV